MDQGFHVCLSHDVDRVSKTFQYATHFLKQLSAGRLKRALSQLESIFLSDVYWSFKTIMDMEQSFGLRSSFYFLNESYPFKPWDLPSWRFSLGYYDIHNKRVVDIIKKLDADGCEIGVHGSYLSFQNIDLLKKEKQVLEQIVDHPIQGIRQHFLNLDEKTWRLQEQAGFDYDASFGFTRNVGFRDNKYSAFYAEQLDDFVVVPLAIMDYCLMAKKDPWQQALNVIDEAQRNNGCLVLNWHQRLFNEREFPGYTEMYERLIKECKDRDADFLTIGEYVNNFKKQKQWNS